MYPSLDEDVENGEEDEEQGFFHKMIEPSEIKAVEQNQGEAIKNKLLQKKRKQNRDGLDLEPNGNNSEGNNYGIFQMSQDQHSMQMNRKKQRKQEPYNRKRQICQYWINGACHKGNDCTFSHDTNINKKTELCKYYLANTCSKGEDCNFSHDTHQFPCKFFHAIGFCEKGNDCR